MIFVKHVVAGVAMESRGTMLRQNSKTALSVKVVQEISGNTQETQKRKTFKHSKYNFPKNPTSSLFSKASDGIHVLGRDFRGVSNYSTVRSAAQ
jgi:hypothetical protein